MKRINIGTLAWLVIALVGGCSGSAPTAGPTAGSQQPTADASAAGAEVAELSKVTKEGAAGAPGSVASAVDASGCKMPAQAPPDAGVRACGMGVTLLDCTDARGYGCECVASDPAGGCTGCGPAEGYTCQNKCAPNEYATACGGPPSFDGGFAYEGPPDGCRVASVTPAGLLFYCCPCGS
jgi:hypothetical protein